MNYISWFYTAATLLWRFSLYVCFPHFPVFQFSKELPFSRFFFVLGYFDMQFNLLIPSASHSLFKYPFYLKFSSLLYSFHNSLPFSVLKPLFSFPWWLSFCYCHLHFTALGISPHLSFRPFLSMSYFSVFTYRI